MVHIVFLAPYPELQATVQAVFAQRSDHTSITYEVRVDQYNNDITPSFEGDVIIARGYTAARLKKNQQVLSVELKTSGYDVIAAVDACLHTGQYTRIAAVGALNMIRGVENVARVYPHVDLACYMSEEEEQLESLVMQAKADGAQAVVGGCSTVNFAKQSGIDAVLIESGTEAINNAIDEALRLVLLHRQEAKKHSEIANILNYSFQGILSTDQDLNIVLANDYCGNAFAVPHQKLLGELATDFFPSVPFVQVLSGKKVLSEVHKLHSRMFMVNCVPVEEGGRTSGCVLTFQDITTIQEEEGKIRKKIYDKGFVAKYTFSNISAEDGVTQETVRVARRFAGSASNLLIFGETGTGKEVFAQSIHNESQRRNGPFVAINCGALSEQLLESELFGYVEGAFTGAAKGGKVGLFEIAHKGTIFLDEIGDISASLQARLLRVLQEREIIRLGHDRVIPIDVRVISATNKDLRQEVEAGRFRLDLLYRLDVLKLTLPPLRQRRGDILPLIDQCIQQERQRNNGVVTTIAPEALPLVEHHQWWGNIRELRNFCERLCVLCEGSVASERDVVYALDQHWDYAQKGCEVEVPSSCSEQEGIVQALARFQGNRSKTAAYLGMDKSTLWRKMKKYQL